MTHMLALHGLALGLADRQRSELGHDARPDWVVSRNCKPLPIEDDEGVLKAA